MTLCDVCLERLGDDDIAPLCNACWDTWESFQEQKCDWQEAE